MSQPASQPEPSPPEPIDQQTLSQPELDRPPTLSQFELPTTTWNQPRTSQPELSPTSTSTSAPTPPLSQPGPVFPTTLGKEQFRAMFNFRQRPDCDTVIKSKKQRSKPRPKPSSGLNVDNSDKVTCKASPFRSKSGKRKSDNNDGEIK